MKNLKKPWYYSRYLMSVFLFFGLVNVQGVQGQCNDLDVSIQRLSGFASICQDHVIYEIEFAYNGLLNPLGGEFTITVDPSGNDFVTIEDIVSGPNFTIVSGQGTGEMTVSHPGFVSGVYTLEIELGFSCDLWDNLNQLTGYVVEVTGFNPTNGCFLSTSIPFDIGYATVEPDPVSPPDITADLGEPFTVCANLLVNGQWPSCDTDFILFADFDSCINFDDATIIISESGYCNFSYQIPPGNVTPTADGLEIVVNLTDCPQIPWPPKRPCLGPGNFPGQYGDIVVKFFNLKKTCCGDGGSSDIVFSTTTCDYDSPSSCTTGGQLETQFTSGVQTVWTPNGGVPELTITPSSTTGVKICDDDQPFELSFEICNTSDVDAYNIDLLFNNGYGLLVSNASITYDGQENFLVLSGTSTSHSLSPVGGIGDANMDMITRELEAGDCFTFWVSLKYSEETSCLFDGLSCPASFSRRPFQLQLDYDNQCGSLIPKAETNYYAPYNDLSASTSYVDPQAGNLPEILEENTEYEIGICMGPLDQSGWSGISDHGDLNQCVSVTSNYPDVTYTTLAGDFGTVNVSGGNNFILPPGVIFDSECAILTFEFSCDGAPSEPIHFDVEIKAFWDDCPDCGLVLGCPEIDLYTVCGPPGGGGNCPVENLRGRIINQTVAGQTTTEGSHRGYPCDQIRMAAQGTMTENFSGNLSACYLYQNDIPVVFTSGTATLRINNINQETVPLTSSGGNIFIYEFTDNYNLVAGDIVRVNISVNIEADPLTNYWQNLDLFAVGIGFGESLCKVTDVFTVLDYDIDMYAYSSGDCCTGLSRDFRIEYTGGGFGDDFPNMHRTLGEFTNGFLAAVDDGIITEVTDFTMGSNPLGLSGQSVNWDASDLADAKDKTSFNATIHRFRIDYEPGCGDDDVELAVNGHWQEGTYAGGPPCTVDHVIIDTSEYNFTAPIVNSVFISDEIVVYENTATLNTNTWVTYAKACNPWVQIEYDPTLMTISYLGGNNVSVFNNGTKAVIAVELPMMDVGDEEQTQFHVEFEHACDSALVVDLIGSHYCKGGEFPDPAICSDDLDCEDSNDQATIDILPSEVNFAGFDCDEEASECEVHYFSFVLDNQEDGSSYDVGLLADLPSGFSIVEAYFDYPYSGNVNNCDLGTSISNISDFTNGGWLIETDGVWGEGNGFLPGESHDNSTTAQRTFHIVLGIIGSCDVDENDLLASFEAIGTLNCGDDIDLPPFEAELNVGSPFVIPEVEVDVDVNIKCVFGSGQLVIDIDFVDDNLEVDPDQIFKLNILGGSGYNLQCLSPIEFPYGDATFTCAIDLLTSACDVRTFEGSFILSTCLERECNGEVCDLESAILLEDDFYFHPEIQELIISDITFDEQFCDEDSEEIGHISVTIENINVDFGTNATFQLWCDVNGNCKQDQDDVFIQGVSVSISGASQQFNYTMTPAQFHSICGGGQVVVTLSNTNNNCLCVRDYCDALCCPCPEWDVSFVVDDNDICFDIVSPNDITLEPDCVEYYADGELHAIGFAAPWCFGLPEGTEEVCLIIYSDQIFGNGCDTLRKVVEVQSSSRKKCEGECDYKWCATLNECQLDIDFGASFKPQGDGLYTMSGTAYIFQNNGGTPTYTWTLNGLQFSMDETWTISNLEPGEYEICLTVKTELESGEECTDKICHTIVIGEKGMYSCENFFADFTWSANANNSYTFADASKGPGKVISWSWEVDRRKVSNKSRFAETFNTGIYRVKLTVTYEMNKTICTKSVSKWIIVGSKSKSQLRLSSSDDSFESSVYPNPHNGLTNVEISADADATLKLTIYGVHGNIVWEEFVNVENGTLNKALDMQRYEPGIYTLVIKGETYYETHRIVLTR